MSRAVLADDVPSRLAFRRTGTTIELATGQTILEAAEEPVSRCRSSAGPASAVSARRKLVSGRVTMDVQDALTAGDRAKGFILACQAHALTHVEVDA